MRHIINILENQTGIVMPLYLHPTADTELALTLLDDTVYAYVREINDPAHICLSVDGSPTALPLAEKMVADYGVQLVHAEKNRGKFSAVRHGAAPMNCSILFALQNMSLQKLTMSEPLR